MLILRVVTCRKVSCKPWLIGAFQQISIFTAAPLKRIQTTPVKRDFDFPLSFHYQQILNWWFVLVVWIPGIPYERDCYLGVPLKHRDPDHQFTHDPPEAHFCCVDVPGPATCRLAATRLGCWVRLLFRKSLMKITNSQPPTLTHKSQRLFFFLLLPLIYLPTIYCI